MLTITRRKWVRYGSRLILSLGLLGLAWLIVNTQRYLVVEVYAWLTHPFHRESSLVQKTQSLEARLLENIQIKELKAQVAEYQAQNQQLKTLFKYSQSTSQKSILAPVIARSPDNWWSQIILGRGQSSQIKVGDVVTGIGGLVGRVIEVTPNTSRILLISNPTSRVGGIINRSRSMGIIQGKNNSQAVIQFFEKVPNVKKGDLVMTSSVSQLFPSGYLVGRIKSVQSSTGPAPLALIQLSVPLNNLEWVLVHPFSPQ